MSTSVELNPMLVNAAHALDDAVRDLQRFTREYAEAERDYRLRKSQAFLQAQGATIAEREARMEPAVADLRFRRDLAEGLKVASLEAVRSCRSQLSAIQTLASLAREEAAFTRTGPEVA